MTNRKAELSVEQQAELDRLTDALKRKRYPARTWDDMGSAQRLVDHFGRELRYLADVEAWAFYDGVGWVADGAKPELLARVQRTITALPDTEVHHYDDTVPAPAATSTSAPASGPKPKGAGRPKAAEKSERERFLSWVRTQRFHTKHMAMIAAATARGELHARREDFDRDPWLLNVGNGVVDLRTGRLDDHASELLLMRRTTVAFDAAAECPAWERFLAAAQPDPEFREYLRRVVGYTLTGCTDEHAVFMHHGEAQGIRRAFMRVLRALLGQYGQTVPRSTLTLSRGGTKPAIPTDVARMVGVRLLAPEVIAAGHFDETAVLALADADDHSARNLQERWFDFTPVGKLHLAARWMPTKEDGGLSLGAHLHGIEWDREVAAVVLQDVAETVLAKELPGVLNWALAGCADWRRGGLRIPAAARERTEDAVFHDDPAAQWLALHTERMPAARWARVVDLFADWTPYAKGRGVEPGTLSAFSRQLGKHGYRRGRANGRNREAVVFGLALRAEPLERP